MLMSKEHWPAEYHAAAMRPASPEYLFRARGSALAVSHVHSWFDWLTLMSVGMLEGPAAITCPSLPYLFFQSPCVVASVPTNTTSLEEIVCGAASKKNPSTGTANCSG